MSELQRTFDGQLEPTRNHPSDMVLPVDGWGLDCLRERGDCFAVCVPRFPMKTKTTTEEIRQRIRNGEFSNVPITVADSIAVGNCGEGTRKFLTEGGFQETQLTVSELCERFQQLPKPFRDEYANRLEQVILFRVQREILETQPTQPITEETEYYISSERAEQREEEIREAIQEHNSDVFKAYFDNVENWVNDYVRSDDYAGEYAYLMSEGDRIVDSLRKILESNNSLDWTGEDTTRGRLGLREDIELPEDFAEILARKILESDCFDIEYSDEYSNCSDWCLDSFSEGEHEEQLSVSDIREATEGQLYIPDGMDFYDCLAEYIAENRDHCLSRWTRKGEHVANRLREDYATIEQYVSTSLRIDYVLNPDNVETLIDETIVETFRNRKGATAKRRGN